MLVVALVLGLLAFGTPAVHSFNFIFFGAVKQCGSFTVKFVGGSPPTAMPLSLTVVPFGQSPLSIPIDSSAWNESTSTGAAVTFLPFPAGTTFVASLDDATGAGTGAVSDIIEVQGSDDSTCLPAQSDDGPRLFNVVGSLAQCQTFDLHFDPNVTTAAPTARAFSPLGKTFPVNMTDYKPGTAKYTMNAFHGSQVTLVFTDAEGYSETTNLTTIQGNSLSKTKCLMSPMTDVQTTSSTTGGIGQISGAAKAIIGVVAGGVVGTVALLMALLVRRKQNRWREKIAIPTKADSASSIDSESYVLSTDIYISTAPTSQRDERSSVCPLASIYTKKSERTGESDADTRGRTVSSRIPSLASTDIARIRATAQSWPPQNINTAGLRPPHASYPDAPVSALTHTSGSPNASAGLPRSISIGRSTLARTKAIGVSTLGIAPASSPSSLYFAYPALRESVSSGAGSVDRVLPYTSPDRPSRVLDTTWTRDRDRERDSDPPGWDN